MVDKPYIRRFFASGNSAYGFYSLHNNILGPKGKRVIILKGGPGTGKTTILKKVGEAMLDRGYPIEYFHCASESKSLDGVSVPELRAAVVDGTYPHVIDPVLPGAYDEIVNLGEFWDDAKLTFYREEIECLDAIIKEYFTEAYCYLAQAKVALDHVKLHTASIMNLSNINMATENLLEKLLGQEKNRGRTSHERHLFASSITPEGPVNFYADILQKCRHFYFLTGDAGAGKSTLLEKVYQACTQKGLDIEVYRCGFDPQKIDAIVIPEKKMALVKTTEYHFFSLPANQKIKSQCTLALGHFSNHEAYRSKTNLLNEYREDFSRLLAKAVGCLKKAKLTHAKREQYYSNAMDFSSVNKVREKIIAKILRLAS